jgi:hypothetical protein
MFASTDRNEPTLTKKAKGKSKIRLQAVIVKH